MLRLLAGGFVALLMIAGCGDDGADPESPDGREAAVYAAVIMDVADSIPLEGREPSERTVFVLPLDPEAEIKLEVQAATVGRLEDVVEVSFIDDRDAAVDEDQDGAPVREGSALIYVGPVADGERRVVVDALRYEREGEEAMLHFVVERLDGDWQVAERRPGGAAEGQ